MGKWVARNVFASRRGRMPLEREQRLAECHPLLVKRLNGERVDQRWELSLSELADFYRTYGKRPDRGAESPQERFLARWLATQVSFTKRGKNSEERVAKLIAAHPDIARLIENDSWDARWEGSRSELEAFVRRHGRLPSPSRGSEDEKALGRWLSTQKFRQRQQKLSSERLERLLGMGPLVAGYVQKLPAKAAWMGRLSEVNRFVERFEQLPGTHGAEEEHQLACWLQRQSSPSLVALFCEDKLEAVEGSHPMVRMRMLGS